jgi:hypothetical protein
MYDAVLEDDDVLKRLLKAGVDVELEDELGRTPLQIAVMNRRSLSVRLLLGQGGANIAHQDKKGFTVLHHAVRAAKEEYDAEAKNLILLLLSYGADVGMVDNDNKTAWELNDTPSWLLGLKDHRHLVQGVSNQVTVGLKMPEAPSKKDAMDACQGFLATMMEFYYDGKEEYIPQKASIAELIYNPKSGPADILTLARPAKFEKTPICTWYHIPANNVSVTLPVTRLLRLIIFRRSGSKCVFNGNLHETVLTSQDLFAKLKIRVDSVHEHRHEGYTPISFPM